MKKGLIAALLGLSIAACPLLYFLVGPQLNQLQLETALILIIITGASALYCFVVGELSKNYSQMDKLWSILPIAYTWVVAIKGSLHPRLVFMAILVTLWGIRLTFNFARKGAYKLKFWQGEEDYRWKVLREKKEFQPHWKWVLFNLFFISIYQNVLVLLICVPALASMASEVELHWVDYLAGGLVASALILETIADEEQYAFQTKKYKMLGEGKKLEQLPAPYDKGFNTHGLWNVSRHPNYLGEMLFWIFLYVFSIASGIGIANWSMIGALLLVVLFLGSSTFGEEISASKYPEYKLYQKKVSRFIPFRPYRK